MASACILLAVMAAILELSEAAEFGSAEFYAKDIPEQIVETADTNMDRKASLQEVLDLLTVLFYKTSEEELSLLDTNADGFLSAKELEIDIVNTNRIREYIKPGHGDNLTVDEALEFLNEHGMEFSREFLYSDTGINLGKQEVSEAVDFLLLEALLSHFMDFSMLRSQLQFQTVFRLLLLKTKSIEKEFDKEGAVKDGAWNAVRFIEFMNKSTVFLVDPSELPEWLTPEQIRQINVTRLALAWPRLDASRKLSVDEVATFMRLNGFGFGNHVMFPYGPPFKPEAADLNRDGLLSEAELHVWLQESARALLDASFFELMRDGVKLFLGRVANLMERYLKKVRRSGLFHP